MADILRVTTPLVDKQPVTSVKPAADPANPFNMTDVAKVVKPTDPTEILQQNTGFVPKEEAPKILTDLLKDPAVTASLIKNIYLLQEIINLLPANNITLSDEVEQLFSALLVAPEDIAQELQNQEQATTLFKGELFDQLRTLLAQNADKPEFAANLGTLLKGLTVAVNQEDALDSVANNLTFLADNLAASPSLTEKLETVIAQLRQPDAAQQFPAIKEQVMAVLKDVENSVLYSPQMEKILPLVVYNLSRYNDNPDFLPDALRTLLSQLDGDAVKTELVQKLQAFLAEHAPETAKVLEQVLARGGMAPEETQNMEKALAMLAAAPESTFQAHAAEQNSQVMDILAKIITRGADSEEVQLLNGDKLERIVQSLLSSPSNFTPLLHFVVPVEYSNLKAFAEIWIDPNAEGDDRARSGGAMADTSHALLVFDVEGIGRFETELFVQDRHIAMNLMCPSTYIEEFSGIAPAIKQAAAKTGYTFDAIHIGKLERTHSLMDVFTDLPHKRMGIDVRI